MVIVMVMLLLYIDITIVGYGYAEIDRYDARNHIATDDNTISRVAIGYAFAVSLLMPMANTSLPPHHEYRSSTGCYCRRCHRHRRTNT